jgi:hypothetical protein
MPFKIELQDEFGGRIASVDDAPSLLDRLLPQVWDDQFPTLGSIDPYGDTTFNSLQMRGFLKEWASVLQKAGTAEEQQLVCAIESLAQRCRDEVHVYLKFIGD